MPDDGEAAGAGQADALSGSAIVEEAERYLRTVAAPDERGCSDSYIASLLRSLIRAVRERRPYLDRAQLIETLRTVSIPAGKRFLDWPELAADAVIELAEKSPGCRCVTADCDHSDGGVCAACGCATPAFPVTGVDVEAAFAEYMREPQGARCTEWCADLANDETDSAHDMRHAFKAGAQAASASGRGESHG